MRISYGMGHKHTVFANLGESYAEHCIVCTAPSKSFNIAGLQVSNIFIPNDSLRRRFVKEIDRAGYSQLNTMGLVGCQGAYEVGGPWLDELKEYIQGIFNIPLIILRNICQSFTCIDLRDVSHVV